MGCGNSTLQHQHSLTKKYEAGTIRITAMASGLAPATPYFSPYTRNRVKQASAFAQRLQEVFTIYTPVAFNLATLGQIPASPEGMEFSNEHIRQSKIFCTLGPASATEALVQQLVTAGMDVGVLDLSTGNHKEHQIVLDRIRRVEADQACTVAVCMNTKRPNLFTGRLFGRQPLQLIAGQSVSLRGGSSDGHVEGGLDAKSGRITIFVTTDALCQIVKDGSTIILGDDSIVLKVTSISSDKQCEATVTKALKPLGEHCQVIFPGCAIPSPCLAQPTFNDIKNFACAHRVDFVSAAYIQTAEDAQYLRRFMVECDHGETIRLIARIENEVGLRNIDDILGEADGIMLCRSSLAFELGPDKLGLMQKLVAAKAQAAGKFMVVEGQVMDSMAWQPQALPCEMSDVAHAIFDGADGLLLGAATSIGITPVQAVQCTAAVMSAADHSLDGRQAYRHIHKTGMGDSDSELIEPFEAIVSGAARAALDMRAGLIVVLTTTGQSAYLLARYRLGLPILVVSQSEEVMRRCNTVRALFPFPITQAPGDLLEAPLQEGLQHARDQGLCPSGCRVVVMAENLADGPDTLPVLFTRVAPGDAQQVWDGQPDNRVHRTLCPQTASLSIADVVTTAPGPRHTKIMCVLDPAAFTLSTGSRHKPKRPEGLLARLSMGSPANPPSKGTGTPVKTSPVKVTAAVSPVSGAIGAVQAGQLGAGQGGELVHELTALMEAGMDVACFDLSQGTLEQHLDLADHLVEVQQHAKQSGKQIARVLNLAGSDAHIVSINTASQSTELQEGQLLRLIDCSSKEGVGVSKRGSEDTSLSSSPVVLHCTNMAAIMLESGHKLVTDDGSVEFEVVIRDAAKQQIQVRSLTAGTLAAGQQLRDAAATEQAGESELTAADAKAVQQFVHRHFVEYVAAPIRSLADAVALRQALDQVEGTAIQILARIEDVRALPELDKLLQRVAGVYISRSNLPSQLLRQDLPQLQKLLISRAKLAGRISICSADLLASSHAQAKAAPAEVADITNAVLDGCDCVALSVQQMQIPHASTRRLQASDSNSSWCTTDGLADDKADSDAKARQSGTFARRSSLNAAMASLSSVLQCAEGALNASAMLSYLKEQAAKPLPAVYTAAISAVGTVLDCHACLIVTLSRGSQLPLAIAVGRPPVPQMLITDSKATARLCSPAFGIFDLVVDDMDDVTGLVAQARIIAQEAGLWNGRDSVVVVREDDGGAPLIAIQG